MTLPEDKLEEAQTLIREVKTSGDCPQSIVGDLSAAENKVSASRTQIVEWRDFVDDAEVIDDE